jgi:hypothetical protein
MSGTVEEPQTANVTSLWPPRDGHFSLSQDGDRSIWALAGPTALVVALLVLATAYSGAFSVRQWAPPTLFVLLVLASLSAQGGGARLPDRWIALALAGMWGLAGWEALSALWAASPDAALSGAGEQTLYAAVTTLPFVAVGDVRALRVAARGIVAGIAVIALYTLARMLFDGSAVYLAGRLNDPIGYRNATALLFAMAFWPAIVAAASRDNPRFVRACSLGLAELVLGLAFVTQSRGTLLGLVIGAIVAIGLGGDRMGRFWLALLAGAVLAAGSHWLLDPFHAFAGGTGTVSQANIATAGVGLLVCTLVCGALGMGVAVFEAGLRPAHPVVTARLRTLGRVGVVIVVLAGLAGGLAAVHGNPIHEAKVKWDQFTSLQSTTPLATRYTSVGGQRYDLYRVALDEWKAHPALGVGMGSYQFEYYKLRGTDRNVDDPHGLIFQLLAEVGIVGLALLVLFIVGIVMSLRMHWYAAPDRVRRPAAGLAAAGATFVGQSLVDWMFRIPGLTAIGLLCFAVAAALVARGAEAAAPAAAPAPRGWSIPRRVIVSGALVVSVLLVLSLYLSQLYIGRAADEKGISPSAQLADARAAHSLDPWLIDAHYEEASALETLGDPRGAIAQLEQAHKLEPENQVPYGLLGDFEARHGNAAVAAVYYRKALQLNPLDVGLQTDAREFTQPARKAAATSGRPPSTASTGAPPRARAIPSPRPPQESRAGV